MYVNVCSLSTVQEGLCFINEGVYQHRICTLTATLLLAGPSKAPQIVSATNTACNIYLHVTYSGVFGITLTVINSESDVASAFVGILGLALAAKICSDQPRLLETPNESQAFPLE